MQIIQLNTFSGERQDGGGTERVMISLARALIAHGHQVTNLGLCAGPPGNSLGEDGVIYQNVKIRNIYMPASERRPNKVKRTIWHLIDSYNPIMRSALKSVLREAKPDIAIVHNLPGWTMSAIDEIHSRGIPIIQILHDFYTLCPKSQMFKNGKPCKQQCFECKILRIAHSGISNKANAVIGVSNYVLDKHISLRTYAGVPIKRVIHNIVSREVLDQLRIDLRSPGLKLVGAAKGITFGYIGTISEHKGVELLLKTFSEWNDQRAVLLMAGDGEVEYVDRLRNQYTTERIKFIGRVEARFFYPMVDVTIVPSLWNEIFGLVACESLAFGKPVIASRRGGLAEIIIDRRNGLLFDPDVDESLLHAMDEISNPEVLEKLICCTRDERYTDRDRWYNSYATVLADVALEKHFTVHELT